ncbi:hypothetical protein [Aquabacterium sp.]|uniref:hypothetical protein n=1 Tax=Aquabacterium sp. TaxID=1872578 RepID=UPI0037850093
MTIASASGQVGQHVFHVAHHAQQVTEVAAALGAELLAQVARSHGFGDDDRLGQRLRDAADQQPQHHGTGRQAAQSQSQQPVADTARQVLGLLGMRLAARQRRQLVDAGDADADQRRHQQRTAAKGQRQTRAGLHVRYSHGGSPAGATPGAPMAPAHSPQ